MLHWLILIWAVVVLLFCAVAVFLILTRPFARIVPQSLPPHFQEQDDPVKTARLLNMALAQTQTDAEFERVVRRLLTEGTASETETQWAGLLRMMEHYRRPDDPVPATRRLAQRLLDNFPQMRDRK